MSDPDPSFDQRRLHELASAVLDGTADESQLDELTLLLRDNPAARDEYLALVDLHAVLSTELAAKRSTDDASGTSHAPAKQPAVHGRRWIPIAVATALAACILFVVTWLLPNDSSGVTESFALIAQTTDAVWESGSVSVGDRLGATTLRLQSGLVRLEFDSGVEVTLEGPAEFQVIGVAKTRLASGLLTATVPSGAEGFTVDTPSAQVIDLGTSFGIDVGDEGQSNVSVFEGEVEVSPRDATAKRVLTEGESVRVGTNNQVQEIRFDIKPFEKMWPIASGIAGSTDSIHFVPPWPKQIRFVQSDDRIFVRPEGHSVQLNAELKVNISQPSDCSKTEDLTPSTLPVDQRVRSYILHYSPETQLGPRRARQVSGSITFDRAVLGIIVRHEELLASSRRFGRRGAGEINQRRELKLTGDIEGDRIALSEDRKTVTLDLKSPGRSSDLVRVIVEGSSRQGPTRRPRNPGRFAPRDF